MRGRRRLRRAEAGEVDVRLGAEIRGACGSGEVHGSVLGEVCKRMRGGGGGGGGGRFLMVYLGS